MTEFGLVVFIPIFIAVGATVETFVENSSPSSVVPIVWALQSLLLAHSDR
jgi:hypothetical protein